MSKDSLYLSDEQDINGIISECEKNMKIHSRIEYYIDMPLLPISSIMIVIFLTMGLIIFTRHYLLLTKYIMFVVGIVILAIYIIGMIVHLYQNRYYKIRDYKTMNIKKRYGIAQQICKAYNLSLAEVTEKDIESKISILKKLYEDGRKYRDKTFKIMNKSLVYSLGLIISAALAMKGKIILDIISLLISVIVAIIVSALISCTGSIYEVCRYAAGNFWVPYGHLIDYSIYWLKFLKEELPEIRDYDYLKKRKSMQDIENYEKEVSIKKFAKVYIEWKNLSSNKEKQVINILKEESEFTIQMLDKRKHFEKLSKELDEKLKKSNSLSE
ncbi:hypothetical protein K7E17_03285 [Ligilactobacillus salivarius]|uniref:hypothetical protein n=1 Tax=Ligilactobacillus salivarius TaxID=1624 RepID=UPI001CBD7969|nr:hypothetical protein [Ligilactobacillus salivarius]MBZ4024843.1 hypothetical protein [Ligilactobacillus salivarius]